MEKTTNHYILDNVLSMPECLYLYHRLQETNSWYLSRSSITPVSKTLTQFSSFPGFIVETEGEVFNEYFSGHFRSLIFKIRDILKKEHKQILPSTIKRIHLGAKNSQSKSKFHIDSKNENAWTILGFLNPVWNTKDGGEFYLEDTKIEYKTARFVIFKSNINHDGGFVTNDALNNWRISVNVILEDKE